MGRLFRSRKFMAALSGVVAVIVTGGLSSLGVDVGEHTVNQILSMLGAYIVGQGLADLGKESHK